MACAGVTQNDTDDRASEEDEVEGAVGKENATRGHFFISSRIMTTRMRDGLTGIARVSRFPRVTRTRGTSILELGGADSPRQCCTPLAVVRSHTL